MTQRPPSFLLLSLDLELAWGLCHTPGGLQALATRMQRTHHTILPRLLDTFVSHDIHATWAMVGLLACENGEDARQHMPSTFPNRNTLPNKQTPLYQSYQWLSDHTLLQTHQESLFAPRFVKQITQAPGQELATHTFAHIYPLTTACTPDHLRADLLAAQAIHQRLHAPFKSIVFPGNQYDQKSLQICRSVGLSTFRGNPPGWLTRPRTKTQEHKLLRALRGAESYLPAYLRRHHAPASPHQPNTLYNAQASRFFRPPQRRFRCLEYQKLETILQELETTAQTGGMYHLWWHPHNFVDEPELAFAQLLSFLTTFARLRTQYGMKSVTMHEWTQQT